MLDLAATVDRIAPRALLLKVLDKVEKAFTDAPASAGRDFSLRMIAEVRVIVDREWTDERQKQNLAKAQTRYDAFVKEATAIVGQDRWAQLETDVKGGLEDVEALLRRSYNDWTEVEKSEEWVMLRKRVEDVAFRFMSRSNVMEAVETIKNDIVQGLEKDPLGVFSTDKSLSALIEEGILLASTHISSGTAWASRDDDDSIKALIKFKGSATAPATVTEVVLKTANALPVVRKKIATAKADVDGGAAVKFHKTAVSECLKVLTEKRLEDWSASIAASLESEKSTAVALRDLLRERKFDQVWKLLKQTTLSLILRFLPHAQMPPMEGVREGFAYTVNKIDLSNFSVHPDSVRFSTQGTFGSIKRGDPFVRVVVDDVTSIMKNMTWSFKQENFPYLTGQGECDADVRGVCIVLGLQVVRRPRAKCGLKDAEEPEEGSGKSGKSSGASGAAEKDKRAAALRVADDDVDDDEKEQDCIPQLVLGVSRVHIDSVKIELKGMAFGTMLADMFSASIRTYLASLIEDELLDKVNMALDRINAEIFNQWETVTAAVDFRVMELPTENKAGKRALALETPVTSRKDVYSVTFAHEGPMGIVLGRSNEFVIVRGFKRAADGSMFPGEASGKIKIGDVLCGLNGAEITSLPLDRVTARLARARRPLTLSFSAGTGEAAPSGTKRNNVAVMSFNDAKLGLLIKERPFQDRAAVVTGFKPTPEGGEGPAQKAGVPVGWVLAAVNGQDLLKKTFKQTMEAFASAPRPVELRFVRDPDFEVELNEAPTDLKVALMAGSVVVSKFDHLVGPAQAQVGDKLVTGDWVSSIGGKDTSLMRFEDIIGLVRSAPRPLEMRFAREGNPNVYSAIFGPGPLGIVFYKSAKDGKCSFKTFQGIEGPVERTKLVMAGMVLLRVNSSDITSEEQGRDLLAKTAPPVKLRFRDMDAWMEGKW